MNSAIFAIAVLRRFVTASFFAFVLLTPALAQIDPLPSWNEGPTKAAILEFVKATTDSVSPKFVPPEARIATFDQDGTTWVEQPIYTQVMYCLDRVPALAEKKPELKNVEPFKTVLSGDREAMAKLPKKALEEILVATLTGMTVDEFTAEVSPWMATAKHPRFKRLYTELTYLPMLEVMRLFRDNGYKTYFVTGGGQDFVRVYSEATYGVPAEHVVGSAGAVKFGYDKSGKPILTKEPKLLLDDDKAGKPEGIHLVIGRRPVAAFGNSIGDKEMLEYHTGRRRSTPHGSRASRRRRARVRLWPNSKVGTFPDALMEEAKSKGWTVISMKNDWKRVFAFE